MRKHIIKDYWNYYYEEIMTWNPQIHEKTKLILSETNISDYFFVFDEDLESAQLM